MFLCPARGKPAEVLEAGERRGRLLWQRRMLLALVDGVAVAAAFLIALNLRSAEIRHEFFAAPGWPMLIVLLTWYASAELSDGYGLVNTVNPGAEPTPTIRESPASGTRLGGFISTSCRRQSISFVVT